MVLGEMQINATPSKAACPGSAWLNCGTGVSHSEIEKNRPHFRGPAMLNTDDKINITILVVVLLLMALIVPQQWRDYHDAEQWRAVEKGWGK